MPTAFTTTIADSGRGAAIQDQSIITIRQGKEQGDVRRHAHAGRIAQTALPIVSPSRAISPELQKTPIGERFLRERAGKRSHGRKEGTLRQPRCAGGGSRAGRSSVSTNGGGPTGAAGRLFSVRKGAAADPARRRTRVGGAHGPTEVASKIRPPVPDVPECEGDPSPEHEHKETKPAR